MRKEKLQWRKPNDRIAEEKVGYQTNRYVLKGTYRDNKRESMEKGEINQEKMEKNGNTEKIFFESTQTQKSHNTRIWGAYTYWKSG